MKTGKLEGESVIKPSFNKLSLIDRTALRSAALTREVTSVIREDVERRPWTYPFYAAYLGFILLPIPVPGANVGPVLLMVGWAQMEMTPWARWANARMKRVFNDAALMKESENFLEMAAEKPGEAKVKHVDLAKHTFNHTMKDALHATGVAARSLWRALRPGS